MVVREHVSSSLPHHSPILQPVTSGDMVDATQGKEESFAEEIPNLENIEASIADCRVDKTLYYLMPGLPLLLAQAQRDYNWGS